MKIDKLNEQLSYADLRFLFPGRSFISEMAWLFSCHWLIEGEYDDCLERFLTDNGKVVLHMSERIIE